MNSNSKISELTKKGTELKFDGGGGDGSNDVCIVEKADNGYILRLISHSTETESVMVYNDREALLREISKNI